jgi:hypothetical protein
MGVAGLFVATVILGQSSVKNPHGDLQWDCLDCHTTESWSKLRDPLLFDHGATGFTLTGAHAAAQCVGCHKSPVFSNVAVACIDCHADHHNGQLGTDCQNCHTPRDWQNRRSTLELHSSKGFALTGAHAVADCEACHLGDAGEEYAVTPVACYDCHAEAYTAAQEPNHVAAGFPLDCQTCHRANAASWRNAEYHHSATFPLIGGHRGVPCQSCHATSYTGLSADCYSCHSADFETSTDPNHVASGFTHDCTLCHTVNGWQPANYDHGATAFPLTGAHLRANCVACHATQYAGTPVECYACHQSDFDQSTEPDHGLAQFDHDCATCHTTSAWQPSSFDHSGTGFVLTGQHANTNCSGCHATSFSGTPSDCYSCHQSDFESVTDPNHAQQGFDHDCTVCHTTSGWSPSSFNHANTAFPLTGAHTSVLCVSCHATGYAGTPTDCYSCHQTDYVEVTDPNHVSGDFDHDCTVCHGTTAWSPSTFDHSATAFPLTGAHTSESCVSCHATGFTGTPTACYSCHQSAYESTSDPSHAAAGFPIDCQTCHTTSGWSPANWDHDGQYFPIYSGAHRGEWNACSDCHVSQASFAVFECINCHEHNRTDTDDDHSGVQNYEYVSTACYSCHPRGNN